MTPIVYLHGFASGPSSSKARFFEHRLASAGARVSIPDLAAGDFERLTISGQLRVLGGAAGSGPVRLIGSSLGGYLAALFAARHREVQRLVLLAPAFCFHRRWSERLGAVELERWRTSDAIEVFHYGEERSRRLRYDLMTDSAQYEDYPEVHQPTLLIHGRRDDIVPVEFSQEFAAGRPNVRLEVVESGHDLLNVLEGISGDVVKFLTGAGESARPGSVRD